MRTIDPIRRGLRLQCAIDGYGFRLIQVRTIDPIRRGLRRFNNNFVAGSYIFVRTIDPIRRGLRLAEIAVAALAVPYRENH